MKLDAALDDKNPLHSTLAGILGGATSFIMPFLDDVEHLARILGTCAGATIAIWSLAVKIRQWFRPPLRPPQDDIPFR